MRCQLILYFPRPVVLSTCVLTFHIYNLHYLSLMNYVLLVPSFLLYIKIPAFSDTLFVLSTWSISQIGPLFYSTLLSHLLYWKLKSRSQLLHFNYRRRYISNYKCVNIKMYDEYIMLIVTPPETSGVLTLLKLFRNIIFRSVLLCSEFQQKVNEASEEHFSRKPDSRDGSKTAAAIDWLTLKDRRLVDHLQMVTHQMKTNYRFTTSVLDWTNQVIVTRWALQMRGHNTSGRQQRAGHSVAPALLWVSVLTGVKVI